MSERKRICLIGGAGFCGHHLALALAQRGHEVSIIDGLTVNHLVQWGSSTEPFRDTAVIFLLERLRLLRAAGVPLSVCDAREYHELSLHLGHIRPDTIIHLAAVAHTSKSNKSPYATFDHSLRTLENALDYARGVGLDHFIFQSSSLVYGQMHGPATEEDVLAPIGIYGNLKLAAERMVMAYSQVSGLPYTITRPSALYGPRCVSRRVVQVFLDAALRGESLPIAGNGEEKIDFTYIEDWVQGMVLMVEKPEAQNQIWNLTFGQAHSLNDVVEVLRAHFPDVQTLSVARETHLPFRDTLSIEKARTRLGYQPQYPLNRGIAAYLLWRQSPEVHHDLDS